MQKWQQQKNKQTKKTKDLGLKLRPLLLCKEENFHSPTLTHTQTLTLSEPRTTKRRKQTKNTHTEEKSLTLISMESSLRIIYLNELKR